MDLTNPKVKVSFSFIINEMLAHDPGSGMSETDANVF